MQLESPKELLLRMCVLPFKLWFVPHNCRQEGWHVLYRNLLHCQNPCSEFSKWTVLLEKYCVTKFIHTWERQRNASKSKYFSWPDLSFGVLVSFSRQTDFQDWNIPSWLKTDKILAGLCFFQWDVTAVSHVALPSITEAETTLMCEERADFSPPFFLLPCPTLWDSPLRTWWWPHKEIPSFGCQGHLPSLPMCPPGSQRAGSNTRVTEGSSCWGSTASAPLINSFLFSQSCLCFSPLHAGRGALCSQRLQLSEGACSHTKLAH